MAVVGAKKRMMTEAFFALPDDGIERMLMIRGVFKEGLPASRRGRNHLRTEGNPSRHLGNRVATQPEPRGEVLADDAAFRFEAHPDTAFGIDVAYISPEISKAFPSDIFVITGPPVLAVEILSPPISTKTWQRK